MKTKSKKRGVKRRRGQFPTKRSINLANLGEKPLRLGIAIPAIILILVAAAAFSKFLVIDRMNEVSAAQHEVQVLQAKVDAGYEELGGMDELTNLYAHYTYSGFTNEELTRADRVKVTDLIRRMVIPWAEISSWSATGNQLNVELRAESLQQINLIAQQLQTDELVNFCTVNTANTNDNTRGNKDAADYSYVQGRIVIYLNGESGVNRG
jgi:hypothetical protein